MQTSKIEYCNNGPSLKNAKTSVYCNGRLRNKKGKTKKQ